MTPVVLGAVLFAAVLHGTWNAIAKAIPDRLVSSALIGLVHLVVGGLACIFLPVPEPAAWPALLASVLLQTAYLIMLTAAYARTEFSKAYPLTRGVAVVEVTIVSVGVLREPLSTLQVLGVVVVAVALLGLAFGGGGDRGRARNLLMPVLVGLVVASYTLVDGVGVRASGAALGYAAWLFFLQGITLPVACLVLSRDRRGLMSGMRRHVGWGALGGTLALTAYGIVVWAQSVAPLALVSALRETSVLMAAFIGFLFFRERLTVTRVGATSFAMAGVVMLRLGA